MITERTWKIMKTKIKSKISVLAIASGLAALCLTACGTPDGPHKSANGIETSDNGVIREELTSLEVADLMGNGINLGNTMEAYGRVSYGVGADVSSYETCWGSPVTTQEMITGMKKAGFTALRIPVAWTNAMDFESGDFTIGEDYLNRVEEIINYARNEDMYVIVNDHWDGGWWGMFGSANEETRAKAMELYTSMWTQIAERYKEYSDYLIFESANEELGFRLNDTDIAADSGTLSDAECYTVANQINQAFVDTVRSTGGNNENRFLLIAGFGTDITNTCNSQFKMPTDSASDKLLLSVHYYDPSAYCINSSVATWGDKDDYNDQNTMLEKMTQFTKQGYGIVIGEYGVLMEDGNMKENTADYYRNFLSNCDLYGYVPMLWDCSNMYDRNACKIVDDEVASIYLEHSYSAQSEQSVDIRSVASAYLEEALAAAPEGAGVDENTAMAWIMYNSADWNILYSVGDVYDPDDKTAGIIATDVEVTGPGVYTVGLDFTGTSGGYASGVVFSALAVTNAENLYPGCVIDIKEIQINGEPYSLKGMPYTTSDDGVCTRVNLYNAWVTAVPDSARGFSEGARSFVTPNLLDADNLGNVETITVTFEFKTVE